MTTNTLSDFDPQRIMDHSYPEWYTNIATPALDAIMDHQNLEDDTRKVLYDHIGRILISIPNGQVDPWFVSEDCFYDSQDTAKAAWMRALTEAQTRQNSTDTKQPNSEEDDSTNEKPNPETKY